MDTIDEVYYSLLGQLLPDTSLPWVENAFVSGSECEAFLSQIYEARDRLQDRLHCSTEDPDLESILNSFLAIQHILCRKMFLYGLRSTEDALLS